MSNFDDLKLSVESLTGGKNTVLLDNVGLPSIMVIWPKQKNNALFTGGSDVVHPGSVVNTVEKTMYVSKYQNVVFNNRAYSLPMRDPKTSINFDTAVTNCRNKGNGWGLMPFSLWAQIALWCRKNGTMPRGNNQWGHDTSYTHEAGVPTAYESATHDTHPNEPSRIATGSGPATWNHNWLPDGIADMNGNVHEWCAGLRTVDGEIQIIPYANAMDPEVSLAANSTSWKAIASDGSLIAPGTSGSLKYDYLSSKITLTDGTVTDDGSTSRGTGYKDLALASGLTAPELVKALILYPDEPNGDYGGDYRNITLAGERVPICGGYWSDASGAGVFYVGLNYTRSTTSTGVGFRSAFCDL